MTVDALEPQRLIEPEVVDALMAAAAAVYRIDRAVMDEMLGKARQKAPASRARWAVMQALRNVGFNHMNIGAAVGRDHSTVYLALKQLKLQRATATDPLFEQAVAACERVLAIESMQTERVREQLDIVMQFASTVRSIARLVEAQSRALEQQAQAYAEALAR